MLSIRGFTSLCQQHRWFQHYPLFSAKEAELQAIVLYLEFVMDRK